MTTVDRNIAGGRYNVVTATEGGGMTTTINLARNLAAQGKNVVYCTIESDNGDVARRLLNLHQRIGLIDIIGPGKTEGRTA